MPRTIPYNRAPDYLRQAWNRLMQTNQATEGKPWNDPAWDENETAREAYRAACRRAGYKPTKARAGIAIYPHLSHE